MKISLWGALLVAAVTLAGCGGPTNAERGLDENGRRLSPEQAALAQETGRAAATPTQPPDGGPTQDEVAQMINARLASEPLFCPHERISYQRDQLGFSSFASFIDGYIEHMGYQPTDERGGPGHMITEYQYMEGDYPARFIWQRLMRNGELQRVTLDHCVTVPDQLEIIDTRIIDDKNREYTFVRTFRHTELAARINASPVAHDQKFEPPEEPREGNARLRRLDATGWRLERVECSGGCNNFL